MTDGIEGQPTESVDGEDENPPWRTAANLLDSLDVEALRAIGTFAEEDDCFGAEWHADVMYSIILPELREILHEAGLVPAHGPHSRGYRERDAEEAAKAADAADCRETALYRWYDDADLLLYVGISGNLGSRTKGHVKGSSWMEFVARSTVERHPRRSVALGAEEAAIKAEHPIFNFQHNNTPEARRRLVKYLVEHGYTDMLVPAVSRG